MSGSTATYGFLPWMRRGLSTGITRVDGAGPEAPHTTFAVTLAFNDATANELVTANLNLHGPSEVVGIDPRMIVRVDPAPETTNAESNYFPLVEFDQPDFPWRYTPAAATAGDRLRPWLILIVLADAETGPPGGDRSMRSRPSVVTDAQYLPDLSQSWAWAHVQVAGVDPGFATPDQIQRILSDSPARMVSRLMCARHLQPNTAYTAYVVPAFERGRLAGLDLDVPDTVDALAPAWSAGASGVRLPVYHQWRFRTGAAGDFESLVRRLLPPRTLGAAVGWRAMDVSRPGADLPSATVDGLPLAMEGALMSPGAAGGLPPTEEQPDFVAALQTLLNRPDDLVASLGGVPAVAPPLYGRWHAARRRLQAAAAPSWFDEVNRDVRLRAVAGLGVRVVQDQQQQLLAAAWDQVEGIRAVNKRIREAELGAAVASRLIERDWLALDPATTLQISAPILSRILASPTTIRATLDNSQIPAGALGAQFRRATRPFGPIGRRQTRPGEPRTRFGSRAVPTGHILGRLNAGELALPRPPKGTKLRTLAGAAAQLATPLPIGRRLLPLVLALVALLLIVVAVATRVVALPVAALVFGSAAAVTWMRNRREAARSNLLGRIAAGTLTGNDVRSVSAAPGFTPRGFVEGGTISRAEAIARFQTALAGAADRLLPRRVATVTKQAADIQGLHSRFLEATNPERTITGALNGRLHIATDGGPPRSPDDSAPVLAAPVFEQPMYVPLYQLSKDWLLPGVGDIPPDSVTLVVSNQRIIEAYMLGLNHEMARELLWQEYPTDQRGTYFRQFWDVRGYVGSPGQDLRDIGAITDWAAATPLGTHRGSPPPPGGYLVLLVRGQLLERYPNTVIYAAPAALDGTVPVGSGGHRVLGRGAPLYPLFRGSIEPDMTFMGFNLGRAAAVGDDTSSGPESQGWFFVLEEQTTQPRFGLEVAPAPDSMLPTWDGLSWRDLVSSEAELSALGYIDLTAQLPALPPPPPSQPQLAWHAGDGSRASDIAYVTLRKPYRVAVHASDMLPPEP